MTDFHKTYHDVIIGLPTFAKRSALDIATLHLSCALREVSDRPDVSERQKAILDSARELLFLVHRDRVKSISQLAEEAGLNDIVDRHAGRISQEICGQ